MKELEARIKRDGRVLGEDVLKVDSFLNHQVDPVLMHKMGQEFYEYFQDKPITKVLTVESSGIAPAVMTGLAFEVPVVFARKHKSITMNNDMYVADVYSFTKKTTNKISISKNFLSKEDHVLIIDDFLANGQAVSGLTNIIQQADATLEGIGIVIEKTFQKGRQLIDHQNIPILSLARIKAFKNGQVVFEEE
ncbi:MAG: xanthine phosphoribosyltransferase [Lactobacillus sp.]|uniref:Xanthine phosphoribosyltransferase n=1 Tax=Bombilactobacillus bombi TaxID=1303590 RepID=A0A347SSB7_9LACO|nr:xanthine phosphoribosyltransferase [Bombilactobacillus bombi]MCO6541564.1 xanthine phosphoribosyltransferase [Lactobacillus sp.]AXX64926.1 xanthine phosphoribosyltransferase [Bombilactobacillus bombi]MCO6543162.1 xanthine phosphoribosyltransferase [Lactobacillus sp.]RHW45130.1 xanthine phosphoribosyltransferase [Bombilactobacillus bombi]RHW50245.1 xanthine phosphoribosyltransferase [Bombilactobacillus bombi]